MYKLQMKFQQVTTYVCLAAVVLSFIYSLGVSTDVYFLYQVLAIKDTFSGVEVFYAMQPFNKTFTTLSIVLILLSVASMIAGNNTRRKYYFANYFTTAISSIANIGVSTWMLINVIKYKEMFLSIPFSDELAHLVETVPPSVFKNNGIDPENLMGPYSTFWFDVSYAVFAVVIIATLLNIANAVFKTILMNNEKQLLEKGDL